MLAGADADTDPRPVSSSSEPGQEGCQSHAPETTYSDNRGSCRVASRLIDWGRDGAARRSSLQAGLEFM